MWGGLYDDVFWLLLPKFLPAGFYFLVRGHCYLTLLTLSYSRTKGWKTKWISDGRSEMTLLCKWPVNVWYQSFAVSQFLGEKPHFGPNPSFWTCFSCFSGRNVPNLNSCSNSLNPSLIPLTDLVVFSVNELIYADSYREVRNEITRPVPNFADHLPKPWSDRFTIWMENAHCLFRISSYSRAYILINLWQDKAIIPWDTSWEHNMKYFKKTKETS